MIEVVPAVFVSSLLGSVHCLAMCGPLVAVHGGSREPRMLLLHGLGRLTSYAALGALAGVVGRAVDLAGRVGDVQRTAALLAAIAILGASAHAIAVAAGWRGFGLRSRGAAFRRGLVQIRTRRPATRAWGLGVLTGLLPCGWLWAFVVAAAGTASAASGALVMAAFWAGTLPAMTGALAIAGPLIARLRQRLPVVTAMVLLVLGLGTLAARWRDAGAAGVVQPHCHEVAR